MKYIRTKDGRIAEIKENMFVKQSDVLRLVYKDRPYSCVLNGNDEIIKQADTIEELCDEFVIIDNENHKHVMRSYGVINVKVFNENGCKLFGAIWTDKGLIYVAKLNNEGELELL